MTDLFPLELREIWMRPGDAGMEFCKTDKEAFCCVELEADIEVISHDEWWIKNVRMKTDDHAGFEGQGVFRRSVTRARYAELTGPLLDAAKAHLMATSIDWIQERIEEDHLPETSREDQVIDARKHELEAVS